MRLNGRSVVTFLRERFRVARLVFLFAFLWFTVYWALMYWHVLEKTIWNIPGFFMGAFSWPWSDPWLSLAPKVRGNFPREFRPLLDLLMVAFGFAANCTLTYYIASAVKEVIRITRRSSRPPKAASA